MPHRIILRYCSAPARINKISTKKSKMFIFLFIVSSRARDRQKIFNIYSSRVECSSHDVHIRVRLLFGTFFLFFLDSLRCKKCTQHLNICLQLLLLLLRETISSSSVQTTDIAKVIAVNIHQDVWVAMVAQPRQSIVRIRHNNGFTRVSKRSTAFTSVIYILSKHDKHTHTYT